MAADPSPEAFVIHDGETVVYADEVVATLVGAGSRDDLAGSSLLELVADDDRAPLAAQVDRVDAGGAPALGLAVSLLGGSGTPREAIAVTSRVDWEGAERLQTSFLTLTGGPPGPGTTVRDQAMHHAPIGITISDPSQPDNPIVYCNDGFTEITGYPRDDVLGRNCRFLQGEDTRQEPVAAMREAVDAERSVTVDLRNYRADGTMFWNRVTIVPITTPDGELSHFVGFQQDVTDEKLYAREKTLFEQQAAVADQAMFVTDREGTIETVNPAFEEMTGYSAAEAVGKTPRILKSGVQDAEFYEALWETITAGDVWEAELVNETKGGERYRVKQTIVPIENDRGEITHFASIERNITEDVVREQTVNVLNRLLRHNLRTGINVIEGYTELLAEGGAPGEEAAAIDAIREQTASLKKLAERTESIRTLADQDGRSRVWDEAVLSALVDRYRVQYPGAEFELLVDADGSVTVPDAELFELALTEAVENAALHGDRATPHVEIEVRRNDDGWAVVTVRDDGPGIPEDERRVIEAGTETPLTHGSGIGLWIIEWVTTSLGGAFTIADREPRGTEVTLRVPLAD